MKIRILGIVVLLSLLTLSCKDDDANEPIWGKLDDHIFVVNEGQFNASNSSITAVNRQEGVIWNNIFEMVNGFRLGDVCQSMTMHNDRAYIVVNNSSKIEVADATTLESVGTIEGLPSPRYFLPISNDKAYVTNSVFDSTMTTLDVINLNTLQITKSIPTRWGEQMVMADGKVFVGIMNSFDMLVVDPETDTVIKTIAVAYAPNSLQVDKNGQVWALSDGGWNEHTPTLQRINPATLEVEQTFTFDTSNYPEELAINSTKDKLYYLEAGQVWSLGIEDTALSAEALVSESDSYFYGLGVDPVTDYIYVTDGGDFVEKGDVLYYNNDGTVISSFEVGVAPGGFYFSE